MVTFVVERNYGAGASFQMRNEFNERVKRRSADVVELVAFAAEYCAYQDCDFRVDVETGDFAELAASMGRDMLHEPSEF
jgi:hypothetical protein